MVGEVSWDSRFLIGLLMARVEGLLPRRMVCRIDDFHDFRGDSFHHQFQAPPSGKPPSYFALECDHSKAFGCVRLGQGDWLK